MKPDILRAGLSAMYYSGAHKLLAPYAGGIGLIFMLHRVLPEQPRGFAPNRILQVTPAFLDAVIGQVREAGLDIVSLDEAHARLIEGPGDGRFACFTLDDGYRDNLSHAYPVFKRHGVPFTIYVPSDFPSGKGELWWVALEEVLSENESLVVTLDEGEVVFPLRTAAEKTVAFERVYGWLRRVDEDRQRFFVRELCARTGIDLQALCASLIMTWDEIRELVADPLVTIGAHTVGHYALAKLPPARARAEMADGAELLARELGVQPQHFSYPYGDAASAGPLDFESAAELGFKTAVTTRKGLIFPEHCDHLTALPRVSLNGDYQSLKFTQLYLTGAPFALWNAFRKVDAA